MSINVADAQVGDRLPEQTRTTDFANWNRYAAVNYEFVPIHMDDEAGRSAGFASAFGMGNLQWAYLHNLVRDWLGDAGRIVAIDCRFGSPNIRGATVTAQGVVTARRVQGGTTFLDLEIWTQDQDGTKLAPGTATVALE